MPALSNIAVATTLKAINPTPDSRPELKAHQAAMLVEWAVAESKR